MTSWWAREIRVSPLEWLNVSEMSWRWVEGEEGQEGREEEHLAEGVSGATGGDAPATPGEEVEEEDKEDDEDMEENAEENIWDDVEVAPVVGVAPEEVTHGALVGHLLQAVQGPGGGGGGGGDGGGGGGGGVGGVHVTKNGGTFTTF